MNRGTTPETVAEAVSASREKIGRALADTLGELEATVRKVSAAENAGISAKLNEQWLRMRRFESERDWYEAVLDAVGLFCRKAAFFAVRKGQLCSEGSRGMPAANAPPRVDVASAPAFSDTITKRAVITGRGTARDLSSAIAAFAGVGSENSASLIPILVGDRVSGVLYADGVSNLPSLELIANFASASLECRQPRPRTSTGPATPRETAARRSAQVAVAKILLHEFEAVRRGRQERSIYSQCTPSIDAAREKYLDDYPGMPDYVHLEIVRTLANNEPELLGTNYHHAQS